MKLRKAKESDLDFIKTLLRNNDLPDEDIQLETGNFFLGYVNSKKLAVGGIEIYGNCGLLRSIAVDQSFRGRGYGRELCLEIIEYAKQKRASEIYLLTTTAENIFKRIGFQRIEQMAAPQEIRKTTEFAQLCPTSAICMSMRTDSPPNS